MARPALDLLLDPMDPARFLTQCWDRQPQVLSGDAGRFQRLDFNLQALERAICSVNGPRDLRLAWSDAEGTSRTRSIPPALWDLYRSGSTLSVHHLDPHFPALASFAADVKAGLSYAGEVRFNCNLSADGGGANLHIDADAVFILQIEGSKRWEIGPAPAMTHPPSSLDSRSLTVGQAQFQRRHPKLSVVQPAASELRTLTLNAGDVLYVPPGTWHRTRAVGHSLALTLLLAPVRLRSLLEGALPRDAARRQSLPLCPHGSGDAAARRGFERMLADLDARLATLTPGRLHAAWRERVAGAVVPAGEPVDDAALSPEARVRRAGPYPLTVAHDLNDPDVIWVFDGARRVGLPVAAEPFARRLVARARFVAGDACAWSADPQHPYPWDAVAGVLSALLDAGLITLEADEAPLPSLRREAAMVDSHVH